MAAVSTAAVGVPDGSGQACVSTTVGTPTATHHPQMSQRATFVPGRVFAFWQVSALTQPAPISLPENLKDSPQGLEVHHEMARTGD